MNEVLALSAAPLFASLLGVLAFFNARRHAAKESPKDNPDVVAEDIVREAMANSDIEVFFVEREPFNPSGTAHSSNQQISRLLHLRPKL